MQLKDQQKMQLIEQLKGAKHYLVFFIDENKQKQAFAMDGDPTWLVSVMLKAVFATGYPVSNLLTAFIDAMTSDNEKCKLARDIAMKMIEKYPPQDQNIAG